MGTFRIKRKPLTKGIEFQWELRDPLTGQLEGRMAVWGLTEEKAIETIARVVDSYGLDSEDDRGHDTPESINGSDEDHCDGSQNSDR